MAIQFEGGKKFHKTTKKALPKSDATIPSSGNTPKISKKEAARQQRYDDHNSSGYAGSQARQARNTSGYAQDESGTKRVSYFA